MTDSILIADDIEKYLTRIRKPNDQFFDDAMSQCVAHPRMHAKFVITDKEGVFTSNFTSYGLDQGYDVGIKLNEKQVNRKYSRIC